MLYDGYSNYFLSVWKQRGINNVLFVKVLVTNLGYTWIKPWIHVSIFKPENVQTTEFK